MTKKILLTYLKLLATFRNGATLIRALRGGPPVDSAVLWGGQVIKHPYCAGLVETIAELWIEDVYTKNGFYTPAHDDVIIDAGANIGVFSLLMARRNSNVRILALEPFQENYRYLTENTMHSNIRAEMKALGPHQGRGAMQAVGMRSLDHVLRNGDEIDVVTLADLFKMMDTNRIALLKMDIEGAERDIFENLSLDVMGRIDRLAIEYHDNLRPGTLNVIKQKLAHTHRLEIEHSQVGCGIIRASLLDGFKARP